MNNGELLVKMVVSVWNTNVKRVDDFLEKTADADLQKEVAPGRNKAGWLIGHLAAVNDGLLGVYGSDIKVNPEMTERFKAGQKPNIHSFSSQEVKDYWKDTAAAVNNLISTYTVDDWFSKHTLVSEEDFQKEPHRNKLNVLMSRAAHISYHAGQLALIRP